MPSEPCLPYPLRAFKVGLVRYFHLAAQKCKLIFSCLSRIAPLKMQAYHMGRSETYRSKICDSSCGNMSFLWSHWLAGEEAAKLSRLFKMTLHKSFSSNLFCKGN